jgi:dTDP-4-dehydrorhamnose reductase
MEISEKKERGVIHVAGSTSISRYDVVTNIAKIMNVHLDKIVEASMADLN